MSVTVNNILVGEITFPNVTRFIGRPSKSSMYNLYKESDLAKDKDLYNALPLKQRVAIQLSNPKVQGMIKIVSGALIVGIAATQIALIATAGALSTVMIAPAIAGSIGSIFVLIGLFQLLK